MYLVSADLFHWDKRPYTSPLSLPKSNAISKKKKREHPYEKWFKYREKIREADIKSKKQMKEVADFLKQVLPNRPYSSQLLSPSRKENNSWYPLDVRKR